MKNTKTIFLLHLKWKRLLEWFSDLRAEKPGPSEFYLMAKLFARIFLNPRSRAAARKNYIHRLWVCHHCPVFDPKLKRCRKDEDGCGCYVPFKALAPVDCWARETGRPGGWGLDDYNPPRYRIVSAIHDEVVVERSDIGLTMEEVEAWAVQTHRWAPYAKETN